MGSNLYTAFNLICNKFIYIYVYMLNNGANPKWIDCVRKDKVIHDNFNQKLKHDAVTGNRDDQLVANMF